MPAHLIYNANLEPRVSDLGPTVEFTFRCNVQSKACIAAIAAFHRKHDPTANHKQFLALELWYCFLGSQCLALGKQENRLRFPNSSNDQTQQIIAESVGQMRVADSVHDQTHREIVE